MNNEIEEIVEAAVIKTLGNLGIDMSTVEARKEFIADQIFARELRLATKRVRKVGLATAVGVIVTGLLGVLWLGFTTMFHP